MRIIQGRKAAVTGAASGIGRAIALALATEGADLFLIDRAADELGLVAREAESRGVKVTNAVCDLAVPAQVTKAIRQLRCEWDHLNLLINCAGVACYGPLHVTPEEAWRQTMAVNLLAPIQLVHELLPHLLAAEEAHILNVCSFMGLVPWKRVAVYQASKYGLVGFTLALRNDYYRKNFGVTALCPGYVRTTMLANLKDPEAHRPRPIVPALLSTTPEAVAAAVIGAIEHDRGIVILTPLARLAWWMMRLCPSLVDWVNREGWRQRRRIEVPPAPRPDG
jgi:3-oxoacyl-[acyl-carrier protein] reductase